MCSLQAQSTTLESLREQNRQLSVRVTLLEKEKLAW